MSDLSGMADEEVEGASSIEEVAERDPFTALGYQLGELWCTEWCAWTVNFDEGWPGQDNPWPWTVALSWIQDSGAPHSADFAEYTWQFYGATAIEALFEAVNWAAELSQFAPNDD